MQSRLMPRLVFIFAVACLISVSYQKITVTSPPELAEKFNGTIDAKYSTFGSYQYGFATMGKLFYHHNAVNMVDTDYACKPLTDIEITVDSMDLVPIVLVDRGNCTFVTKVRNVQNIGGKVALIVNDREDDAKIFGLGDDGTGKDITIPSILITKQEGEIIKNYIQSVNDKNNQNSLITDIILNIDNRPEEKLLERVDLTLNFIANDKKVYQMLSQLKNNNDIFEGNHINFIPNYITVQHYDYNGNDQPANSNCFCKGRYCSYEHNYNADSFLNSINHEDILMESVRQKCIYNLSYQKLSSHKIYWTYMTDFYAKCMSLNKFDLSCSRNVLRAIDEGIMYDVEKCYLDSFENVTPAHNSITCNKNSILESDKDRISSKLKAALPIVNVNNHTFYGSWNSDNILQALCSNLKNKPSSCFTSLHVFENNEESFFSTTGQLIMFISLLIVVNILIIHWCRRYATRKVDSTLLQEDDLNTRINTYVSEYLKMRDTK